MTDSPTVVLAAIVTAVAGVAVAAAGQIDYSGTVNLGTALILLALGAVTIWNRHRGDSTKILRESRDDWEKRAKELEATNHELAKRPDMAELMDLVRTQADGNTAMAQTILEQLKATGDQIKSAIDMVERHDVRANANIDRLARMIEERASRYRRTD